MEEEDCSSDSSASDTPVRFRKCPHAQLYSYFSTYVPISTCLKNVATCSECRLLLQVVEAFKPGWIDDNKGGRGLIQVVRDEVWVPRPMREKIYTIKLLMGPPYKRRRGYLADTELVSSFQFFRRSREEPMYEEEPSEGWMIAAQSLDIVQDSSSGLAFDRVAKWLSYCLEHDEACEPPSKNFMPRRLIDMGSWDGSHEPFLFEPSKPAPYVCLSYCWGLDTEDVLKSTTDNLRSHYESIPVSKMPPGVQDAIAVCRALRIPHFWVDSLCIVQDDPAAWLEDASQMDRIYLHSRLTIAALEPANCKSRFLGRQRFGDPSWQRRFVVDTPLAAGDLPLEIFIRPETSFTSGGEERCSLDKRGWCLQESLLPNRRLCFNGDEMTWECVCRKICECGHILWKPQYFQYGELGASLKLRRLRTPAKFSNPRPFLTWETVQRFYEPVKLDLKYTEAFKKEYRVWRSLVTEYSQRSLSRRKDKLSAVSGLAKVVRESLQGPDEVPDKYLAGLWRREFHFDLTWKVAQFTPEPGPQKRNHKEEEEAQTRIPSWSWASVDGSIAFPFDKPFLTWKHTPTLVDCAKIESVSCQTALLDDETSAVISGCAVLTGIRAPVELAVVLASTDGEAQAEGKPRAFVRSTNLRTAEVFLDKPTSLTVRQGDAQAGCWTRGECREGCCEWRTGCDGGQGEDKLYCFRLFSWKGYSNSGHMGPETWYLVLKVSPTIKGAFERIGIGMWPHHSTPRDCPLFEEAESITIEIV